MAVDPLKNTLSIDQLRVLKTGEAALDRAFGPLAEGRHWFVTDSTALLFSADALKARNATPAAAEKIEPANGAISTRSDRARRSARCRGNR